MNTRITELAGVIADQIGSYEAPWQTPHQPGYSFMPFNPVNLERYKAVNAIALMADRRFDDPRWLTEAQAERQGWRKTSNGPGVSLLQWQFNDQQGVKLEKPRLRLIEVFNVQQLAPMEVANGYVSADEARISPWSPKLIDLDVRTQAARNIILNAKAKFVHAPIGPARYDHDSDTVWLRSREQNDNPAKAAQEAVHQMCHWAGHESRLDLGFGEPPGSLGHAREELRTNIATMILGDELALGFDPGPHQACAGLWRDIIKTDPAELLRATMAAEWIARDLTELSHERAEPVLSQDQMQDLARLTLVQVKTVEQALSVRQARDQLQEDQMAELEQLQTGRTEELPSEMKARHAKQWQELDERYAVQTEQVAAVMISQENPVVAQEPPQSGVSDERTYLAVPYAERLDAKRAGAQWDGENKAWFAPPGVDLAPLAAWMPDREAIVVEPTVDPTQQFMDALTAAGLQVKGPPIANGKLQRVPVVGDKGGDRSGAYTFHTDGIPAGYIQNFKTGHEQTWRAGRVNQLTDKARAVLAATAAQARRSQEQQQEQQHRQVAEDARALWEGAGPADNHPYLTDKKINGDGLRIGQKGQSFAYISRDGQPRRISLEGRLLVPVYGPDGDLTSLQMIEQKAPGERNRKSFLPGGKMAGAFCLIGDNSSAWPLIVCEGRATGEVLHEMSGCTVAVAFSAGNLASVAQHFREQNPHRTIYVAGDNDHTKDGQVDERGRPMRNVGKAYAVAAAELIGGYPLIPQFRPEERAWSDWQDLGRGAPARAMTQLAAGLMVGKKRALAFEAAVQREKPRSRWKFWERQRESAGLEKEHGISR